jgi:signal transduction histidine kinase/ActR/RegA family two-component response regulator
MPRLDGVALLQAIRADEKIRALPVIMLSARAGEEARVEGLQVGADAYLTKPFSARELLARVGALLELSRVRGEAERLLRDADRRKDEFLATLSHELRTPLTSMLGWVRMLKLGHLNAEQAARALTVIERSTLAQARLIDDLLDVSRIVTGKLHLELRAVDLSAVVETGLETVRHDARHQGIELVSDLDPGAGPVFGDHARLVQVVVNLLTNAVKFTSAGGRIDVRLARIDPHAVLTVTDTGAGIDARDLPHVFDRFRQADSRAARRHGGLGLGLSIARSIVESHKGSVTVSSDGVGQGTTFTVTLPLMAVRLGVANDDHELAARDVATPAGEPAALHGLRILAVDDEDDARDLLSLVLEQAGAQVESVGSVAEAIRALEHEWPDVIVSDLAMPGADGYELIARVRSLESQRGSRVPVVALTAYASDDDRDRVLAAGFRAYLVKPAEPRDLVRTLASLMTKVPPTS